MLLILQQHFDASTPSKDNVILYTKYLVLKTRAYNACQAQSFVMLLIVQFRNFNSTQQPNDVTRTYSTSATN